MTQQFVKSVSRSLNRLPCHHACEIVSVVEENRVRRQGVAQRFARPDDGDQRSMALAKQRVKDRGGVAEGGLSRAFICDFLDEPFCDPTFLVVGTGDLLASLRTSG